jgi:phosphoribosylaminoimidazolecarboxamide formyltransferase/IMP cyclohydrolase
LRRASPRRRPVARLRTERASHATRLNEALDLHLAKKQDLRYGENPHQRAALYVSAKPQAQGQEASVAFAQQLHGKELSYINLLDADGALSTVKEFPSQPAACIVKHTTPCGCAIADDLSDAPFGVHTKATRWQRLAGSWR